MSGRRQFLIGATSGAVGLAVGAAGERVLGSDAPTSADVGFCTDMTVHHLQALAMCQRVIGRDTGDAVQAAAGEVLQNQSMEVGMMRAWLADWGKSTAPPEMVMGWMHGGTEMPAANMHGYATDAQMRDLALAEGAEQGQMWLELMRAHHVGGVAMADVAISLASSDKVLLLARIQSAVQTFEISQYDILLATDFAGSTMAASVDSDLDAATDMGHQP